MVASEARNGRDLQRYREGSRQVVGFVPFISVFLLIYFLFFLVILLCLDIEHVMFFLFNIEHVMEMFFLFDQSIYDIICLGIFLFN